MSVHVYVSSLIGHCAGGQLFSGENQKRNRLAMMQQSSSIEWHSNRQCKSPPVSLSECYFYFMFFVSHLSGGSLFLSLRLLLLAPHTASRSNKSKKKRRNPTRVLFIGITFVHSLNPIMMMTVGGVWPQWFVRMARMKRWPSHNE